MPRAVEASCRIGGLAEALRIHLEETKTQERRIPQLLEARGASPSRAKDLVMRAGGLGFTLFARSQVDTPGKLASHAYAYRSHGVGFLRASREDGGPG